MNTREAMQALLDGKRLTSKFLTNDGTYICLDDYGAIRDQAGNGRNLAGKNDTYELYEEPNPHPKGTFAWAREEANRGKRVVRQAWTWMNPQDQVDALFALWRLDSIDATDWQVVS